MNRKPRPAKNIGHSANELSRWRQQLITRRRFLMASAGGLAALFPLLSVADKDKKIPDTSTIDHWLVIDVVQQQLFPGETNAPGARDINALGYLRFVTNDTTLDAESRSFIIKGAAWLEDMCQQMYKKSVISLNDEQREKVLRRIASSASGENWLATLMLYIVEALLTDPVYGGNTDQLGWKWLQHVPGFPRPPRDKIFSALLS